MSLKIIILTYSFLRFSPDGLQLASSSKNNAVIIWDFNPLIYKLSYNKTIRKDVQHESTYFAWSPCSTKIAVAGSDDNEDVSSKVVVVSF